MADISPDYARNLTERIRAIYAESEDYILRRIVEKLSTDTDADDWMDIKQRELAGIIRSLQAHLARTQNRATREALGVLNEAYEAGGKAATAEAARFGLETAAAGEALVIADDLGVNHAVTALARETEKALSGVPSQMLRSAVDTYQKVTIGASNLVLTGSASRRDASRDMLRRLTLDGIKSMVDASGRSWEAGSYAEMAVRTVTGKAAIQGHTDRLQALGQDLVIVSASPESCPECGPWEGKVLSISGQDATGRAKGSLADARAAGLQHPNCTHTVDIYLPGITEKPKITRTDARYKMRQRQRAFERQVRRHKRSVMIEEETYGKNSAEATSARAKLRDRQAAFKAWRDENDRKNLSYRTNTSAR